MSESDRPPLFVPTALVFNCTLKDTADTMGIPARWTFDEFPVVEGTVYRDNGSGLEHRMTLTVDETDALQHVFESVGARMEATR
jgi:hypothetical protein